MRRNTCFSFLNSLLHLILFLTANTISDEEFIFHFNPPACPLSFPDTGKVAKECSGTIINSTVCCKAMDSYVSHLQKQSFITNLQGLDCASFLGTKLQKMNVSMNVYSACQITLKDFSLQGN